MLRISYTSPTTNEEVLKRVNRSVTRKERKNAKDEEFWTFNKKRQNAKIIVGRKSMCEKSKGTSP